MLIQDYLNCIEIPKLTKEQSQKCEGMMTEEELLKGLKKIPINKSPGNNGITKEFYEAFWDGLKRPLLLSVNKAFQVGELSTSQKQAVIKLTKKRTTINDLLKIGNLFLFLTLTQNWFQKFSLSVQNLRFLPYYLQI